MADCFPEGWGQGLERRDGKPALAINDRNAKFHLTTCPVFAKPILPRKGQEPERAGQGNSTSPGARKNPNLRPLSERATATTEEITCLNCPAYNWTTCAAPVATSFPRGVPASHPPPRRALAKPVRSRVGGGPPSSVVSSGASFAVVVKGETGAAEHPKEEKDTQQNKAKSLGNFGHHGSRQHPPRGPGKSARTAPSCSYEPHEPRGQARQPPRKLRKQRRKSPDARSSSARQKVV